MKVAVFTPTHRYGGLDVNYNGLCRQVGGHDITWLIADELIAERLDIYEQINTSPFNEIGIIAFKVPKTGYRNLAASYNEALRIARKLGVDLFVTQQDYTWIPDNGIDRYAKLCEHHPNAFYTGLCSHSADPPLDMVTDIKGLWTIFDQPFLYKPTTIGWADCRGEQVDDLSGIYPCMPVAWEANWAALGKDVLYDEECYWDEAYDIGVAYENQDFAERASGCGHNILLDPSNHAIALPHRAYFPWQEAADIQHSNQQLHEKKWA